MTARRQQPNAAADRTDHIAAIHTLKSKLQMCDDDYRALLLQLTGQRSSKDCTQAQRRAVREHMARLAEKLLLAPTRQRPRSESAFAAARAAASPRERKVWALWHQLHRDGVVRDASARSLRGFVERQTGGVSDLRFCNTAQLDSCIEGLKAMHARGSAA